MKQIELELGGEKRTFYFGLGFLGNLIEKENLSFEEIDQKLASNPFKWIPLIMYYSCAWGFNRKNENTPFDVFDITEWIDEAGIESAVVVDFFQAFRQSLVKDVPPTNDKKQAKKK